MNAALVTEYSKFVRAMVPRATTLLLVLGISLICSAMLLATDTDDPQLAAKLGPLLDPGGWNGYFTLAAQVTAAGGLIGHGAVLSWMFGREFAEGTISGLFALPVSRSTIATAKLAVYLGWSLAVGIALLVTLIISGLVFGLGDIPASAVPAMLRQLVLTLLTGAIAVPAAWAATLGRSVLTGVATAIGLVVLAQVTVVSGAGGWFPIAAPGLWAISGGAEVSATQLALSLTVPAVGAALTWHAWRNLQLDR
ncbi:hypothetical protein GCM10009789_86630 [Kribbella sancticallisti]|uniref:ABC-2 type transport system permease protein n=1 Tax=Kribbella sancticallisti TaxID=460087 RepID=A0ABP4QSH1_9ACTN